MTFIRLTFAPLVLAAMTLGAQAAAPLTLRIEADRGQIEFYHRGKKLSDSRLEQLCATARRQKVEIAFQREKMSRDNALAAILKEAQCLSATHSGLTQIDREPRSGSHKRAKPRHKAKARRGRAPVTKRLPTECGASSPVIDRLPIS